MVPSLVLAPFVGTRHMDQAYVSDMYHSTWLISYSLGLITMGDILEILPFDDPVVVLEVNGETLWDALENSLKLWPLDEG
jgi:2',3'-cyclic-nucleotide 2'-phosphodiesterase (5'-nucleotidase family)